MSLLEISYKGSEKASDYSNFYVLGLQLLLFAQNQSCRESWTWNSLYIDAALYQAYR